MRYTTLLIDLDETLFDFRAAERAALIESLRDFGIEANEETVAAYHRLNLRLWKELEQGTVTRSRLIVLRFQRLLQSIGREDVDPCALNRRYMSALSEKGWPLPGVPGALDCLSRRYALSVITNGTASVQRARMADPHFLRCFRHIFISEEVGADKPDPVFFTRVLSALEERDLCHILVVGDSPSSDIAGGTAAGLDTCLIARNPDLACAPTYCAASFAEFAGYLLDDRLSALKIQQNKAT